MNWQVQTINLLVESTLWSLTCWSTIKTRSGTHQCHYKSGYERDQSELKCISSKYFKVMIVCYVSSLSTGRQRQRGQSRHVNYSGWVAKKESLVGPPGLFCQGTTPAAGLKGTFEDERNTTENESCEPEWTNHPKCAGGGQRASKLSTGPDGMVHSTN